MPTWRELVDDPELRPELEKRVRALADSNARHDRLKPDDLDALTQQVIARLCAPTELARHRPTGDIGRRARRLISGLAARRLQERLREGLPDRIRSTREAGDSGIAAHAEEAPRRGRAHVR